MTKIYYRIEFELASALSVGSGENYYSDGDVLRNSAGRPFIPGSSLAGIYRALLPAKEAERYFGDRQENDKGIESKVLVYDAQLHDKKGFCHTSVRDCVALDEWKTNKKGCKFDFEVVEPGAVFVTYLEQNSSDGDRDIGEDIACAWAHHKIHIGKKTMRGLGSIDKVTVWKRTFDFSKELEEWLNEFDMYKESCWEGKEWKIPESSVGRDAFSIVVELKQKSGISIRRYTTEVKQENSVQPDMEQLTYINDKKPYIPGTSWAGVFYHHMEKLLPGSTADYFGTGSEKKKKSVIRFGESRIEKAAPKTLTRNAVDRFTGGVVDKALFTEKMWYGGNTELSIEILADVSRQFRQVLAASIADLHMGIMAVGGLTAVGRGLFIVTGITVNGHAVKISEDMPGDAIYRVLSEEIESRWQGGVY